MLSIGHSAAPTYHQNEVYFITYQIHLSLRHESTIRLKNCYYVYIQQDMNLINLSSGACLTLLLVLLFTCTSCSRCSNFGLLSSTNKAHLLRTDC
jgi:hypothetical protein